MKIRCILISISLAGILIGKNLEAEDTQDIKKAISDSLAAKFRVDFAVPDVPAFEVLGANPSKVLRPTSVRELALVVSDFSGPGNTVILPKSFAAEFSPGLLVGGKTLTTDKYNENPGLYRTRLSLATNRPTSGSKATKIAFGIRLPLIDGSDLRAKPDYIRDATELAEKINKIAVTARKRIGPPPTPIELTSEEEKEIENLKSQLKEKWTDTKWNAQVLEFVIAARAASPDSLAKNPKMDKLMFWVIYGHGFKSWGQLLNGISVTAEKDSLRNSFKTSVSISSRLYIGTNQYKMFIENQILKKSDEKMNWLINSGGEARLYDKIWVNFSIGTDHLGDTKNTGLVTNFKLNFGS